MLTHLIEDALIGIDDPRQRAKIRYPLREILFLLLCGVLCNCATYDDIELYGNEKLGFLREFFPFKNGVPDGVTLSRVCSWLDPACFTRMLDLFVARYFPEASRKLIAIDGKTARGSADGFKKGVHCLSAFVADTKCVLAHLKVDGKTNEITAIPELLDMIDAAGSTVTIDAMGCQRDIAEKITGNNADYILGLKGNQGTLYRDTKELFPSMIKNTQDYAVDIYECTEINGGGRIETRRVTVTDNVVRLQALHNWPGLKSVIRVERERERKGMRQTQISFYIASAVLTAQDAFNAVRGHWSIENSLHYVLDTAFAEDASRIRKDNAPENMNILRKFTANIIRTFKTKSFSLHRKQLGWSNDALRKVLTN